MWENFPEERRGGVSTRERLQRERGSDGTPPEDFAKGCAASAPTAPPAGKPSPRGRPVRPRGTGGPSTTTCARRLRGGAAAPRGAQVRRAPPWEASGLPSPSPPAPGGSCPHSPGAPSSGPKRHSNLTPLLGLSCQEGDGGASPLQPSDGGDHAPPRSAGRPCALQFPSVASRRLLAQGPPTEGSVPQSGEIGYRSPSPSTEQVGADSSPMKE